MKRMELDIRMNTFDQLFETGHEREDAEEILIRELHDEGLTVVMISHDVSAAMQEADHILHVGSTVFFGAKDDYAHSEFARIFLGKE